MARTETVRMFRSNPLRKLRQRRLRRRYTGKYTQYARELLGPEVTLTDWFLVKSGKGWRGSRRTGRSTAAMTLFYKGETRYFAEAWCERRDDGLGLVMAILLFTVVGVLLIPVLWGIEQLSPEEPRLAIGLAPESGTFGDAEIISTPVSADALMDRLRSAPHTP